VTILIPFYEEFLNCTKVYYNEGPAQLGFDLHYTFEIRQWIVLCVN